MGDKFRPGNIRSTEPSETAARLSNLFANLDALSPWDVTELAKESKSFGRIPLTELEKKMEYDRNNNLAISEDINSTKITIHKTKYELLVKSQGPRQCICKRASIAYECGRCYQFFYGRVAEVCEEHPSEIFLMDFRECPSNLSWEAIRKFEDAPLPDDDDL
ncbi:uncharacterized protein Dana_GF20589 [Drosophila ananassae]|uniref:Uncharacterized protein n=1 Tax=Drosophila ananassae TaxID=7217 RepID=B3N1Y8_DROAN|nr:uncharacterized protein Dana_GF20589 [Drosophila ananassae]